MNGNEYPPDESIRKELVAQVGAGAGRAVLLVCCSLCRRAARCAGALLR